MAIDGGLRKLFHQLKAGWHWQAVETGGTGLGIPDSNFCHRGIEGWCEYKLAEASAVGLRPEQYSWIDRRTRNGGRVFVAVRHQHQGGPRKGPPADSLYVVPGRLVEPLHRMGLDWVRATDEQGPRAWHGGPGSWDWDAIAATLIS
jgi:hypothetical protein